MSNMRENVNYEGKCQERGKMKRKKENVKNEGKCQEVGENVNNEGNCLERRKMLRIREKCIYKKGKCLKWESVKKVRK
jgi:hypothetical protein